MIRLFAPVLLACFWLGCTPGSSSVRLEARSGVVIDRDSRSPISGADVFQADFGRGAPGAPRPVNSVRWTTSGPDGAFAFDEHFRGSRSDPVEYGFYHADYGLVRLGPAPADRDLVLEAARPDPEKLRVEQLTLCGSRPPDPIVEKVAQSHCQHRKR